MWGYELTDVSIVQKMPNLEVISLSLNKISSLKYFRNNKQLRDLFLRKNLISDFNELQHLKELSQLQTLWLSENPISSDPQYRLKVIKELPNLKKLDEVDITEEEKIQARNHQISSKPFLPEIEIDKSKTTPSKRMLKLNSSRNQKENDVPLVAAIHNLLPELSNESLDIVIDKIIELKKCPRK
ncbi:Leucine Rich Repeat family protein [Tritrichomonas foetus]|uniref:Leucine Rich Repeat family protein n=1 Tax=Tritrichomonas foetus TaxID=1144522 RepID=A0A1J4JFL8_9EUKA|nr:Leucine Rich Repeat family protein [Tritrichomonas foetus]|eukprot:OHS96435.1 Leucine Rich Repeat family protein [Tritrichomonas foetus]